MSSRRSKSKGGVGEELILGGFSGSDSSDSELSETWSELGAQILGDQNENDQNIDDYDGGFDSSCKVEDHQESDVILDMKIDDPLNFEKDNNSTTSSSTETGLFSPSPSSTISSINNPNLHNKLYFKCNLCPASSPTYLCGQDSLRKHIDQVHGNKIKLTTMTVQSTSRDKTINNDVINPDPDNKTQLFSPFPSNAISSINFNPNLHNKLYFKCNLCPASSTTYFCGQDSLRLRKHIDQVHVNKNKPTTMTVQSTSSGIQQSKRHLKSFPSENPRTLSIKFEKDSSGYKPAQANNETEDRTSRRRRLKRESQRAIRRRIEANETDDQRAQRLSRESQMALERIRRSIANETDDQRAQRISRKNQMARERRQKIAAEETDDQRAQRLSRQSQWARERRQKISAEETDDQRAQRVSRQTQLQKREKSNQNIINNSGKICEICGKIFEINFNRHSEIHNEKIYTCSFENCTKSFAIESYLNYHISRIHSPKVHLCDICGERYCNITVYKHHKERHSRLLSMRKEVYEKKVRGENPLKSDQEIGEILQNFWKSEESLSLITAPETYEEKRVINKQDFFKKIERQGLQKFGETIEECYDRINKERMEKLMKKREAETEEERLKRREKYSEGYKNYIQKNKEKFLVKSREYSREYNKKRHRKRWANPEYRAKLLANQRARWAKMAPEKRAQKLESMRNYENRRKRKSVAEHNENEN